MSLFSELRRRNVHRMAALYLAAAWLVMQVVDVVEGKLPLPSWMGSAALAVLIVGFPIALIISWFYEVTPKGISRDTDERQAESATGVTGRRVDFVIIAVLAAVLVVFAYDKWWSPTPEQSVAVLPFVSMTSGEDDGYFADGLTEEILNSLTQLPELQVTARTSAFFFKGQNIPVPEIADRLNVAHIVEGSVRRDGERLRITSQLIRAADGFHLWSQTYDRMVDDIFAVQEDIAENIAESLNVVLDDNARQRMHNIGIRDVEAFIAYQKGLDAYIKGHQNNANTMDWLAIANPYLDQALEAVPGLTVARLMRADVHAHNHGAIAYGARDEEYPGEEEKALAAYRDAYDLATQLSPPGRLRDNLQLHRILISEDWTGLGGRIRKAMQPGGCVQLKPDEKADVVAVDYGPIVPFGWAEQVAERYREIIACDPMDVSAKFVLARVLIWAGDPEEALRVGDEAASRDMRYGYWGWSRLQALLAAGRVSDAMAHIEGSEHVAGIETLGPLFRAALAGDAELARQLAKELCPTALGCAALAGDRERANEIAARIDAHPGGFSVLTTSVFNCKCGAPFDLEATPNYKARIEEAGFTWPPVTRIDYPTKTW